MMSARTRTPFLVQHHGAEATDEWYALTVEEQARARATRARLSGVLFEVQWGVQRDCFVHAIRMGVQYYTLAPLRVVRGAVVALRIPARGGFTLRPEAWAAELWVARTADAPPQCYTRHALENDAAVRDVAVRCAESYRSDIGEWFRVDLPSTVEHTLRRGSTV